MLQDEKKIDLASVLCTYINKSSQKVSDIGLLSIFNNHFFILNCVTKKRYFRHETTTQFHIVLRTFGIYYHVLGFMMFVSKFCTIFLVLEATFFTLNVCAFSKMVKLESVFRFANIYGDHMVLQMKPFSAVVWGFGEIGQTVDVKLGGEVQTTEVVKGEQIKFPGYS